MPRSVAEPGHEFLARKLREASNPVTVLITGPVSNLAVALKAEPDLVSRIETVVWMGGALNVSGNVRDYEHDGSAEWNAYWDPPAVHSLWHWAGWVLTGPPTFTVIAAAGNFASNHVQFDVSTGQHATVDLEDVANGLFDGFAEPGTYHFNLEFYDRLLKPGAAKAMPTRISNPIQKPHG